MFVRLLGPVELVGESGPVRLGGEKERTALAAMAVARGRPVDGSQLVAALWDGEPPRSAVKSMQTYVARLRSVAGDAIASTSTGYVLHAEVDLEHAERLVDDGLRALAAGDARRAAERFSEALGLWTGSSVSGVTASHPMERERVRLDELHRTTAEYRITALLECGHGPDLVGELEVMVGEEPLRERRWALLITALYGAGRQADALRAYQRLRQILEEQLGIDPSTELQELECRVLARDPALETRAGRTSESLGRPVTVSTIPAAVAVPFPPRLRPPTTPFAGRAAELARLQEAWTRSTAKGGHGVVVSGEPGIGKTTSISRFAESVHADGAVVVLGECDEDLGTGYQPWIEILSTLVEHLPAKTLIDHVEACGGVLSRLAPSLGRRVELPATTDVEPESERFLLFGAVVDLLARSPAPLLVVVDDLHWADRPSVQLLRHVMTSSLVVGVLVVGAYRPSDLQHGDPLPGVLAELRRVEGVTFVSLGGLDDTELLELVRATCHELDDGGLTLRDALAAETGGNPFFVLEIVRHLVDTGALDDAGRGSRGPDGQFELGLPVSVRQVIGQRVARLGGTTHRVLREAAVIGHQFDLDVLADITELSPEELLELLGAAAAASVIVNAEGDRFHFAHALIAHALYAELLPARRARTHRRVATWLEQRHGDEPRDRVQELARHWAEAATIDGADRAVEWARRAGDHAMQRLAPDQAVRWYTRALELLGPGSRDQQLRRTLQVDLGNAERQAGDPMHRRRLLDAARTAGRAGDLDVLVEAALANNSGVYGSLGEVDRERVAVLELALSAARDVDDRVRARLLATLSAELTYGGSPRSRELAMAAVAAARRSGDAETLCDVLTLTDITRRVPWLFDERERGTREALELATGDDDPARWVKAALRRHHVLLVRGERADARRLLDEAESIADRLELPNLHWIVRRDRVLDASLDGDLDLAEARAARAFALDSAAGQTDASARHSAQLLGIRNLQGRLGELVPAVSRLVADKPDVATFQAVLAIALLQAGQVDRARATFADLTVDLDQVAADPLWSTHMGLLADTAIALGDRDAAAEIYERLSPFGHQISLIVGVVCDGAISHRLGGLAHVLGRRDDAVDHLVEALELHRRLASPLHVAATEVALARLRA